MKSKIETEMGYDIIPQGTIVFNMSTLVWSGYVINKYGICFPFVVSPEL